MEDPYAANRRKSVAEADSDTLALLGKKQVLKRRFGFWSLFGFAVCELITWETVLALFSQGFNNGGPGALVYGFIIAWSSTLSVYTVISELASIAPIAAGQYYWVYMLAPQGYKKVLSYLVGWLTSLAWIATVATETIFAGTILQGLIILNNPDTYDPKQWHGTLLAWLVVAVAIFINVIVPGFLPKLEIGVIFFHLAGFVGIIAALWATAPIADAHFVFATSLNEGGWPTQGLSYCVGFLGNVATFVGADASVHMAEEVEKAAISIPRAICASMLINGCVGFIMMVTTLFCLGDVTSVLETATGYPFLQIFYNSVGNRGGAVAMGAIVLMLTWACATGIITTASRMTWSFARDKGTPASRFLSKVAPHNKIPVNAVFTVCVLASLLTLIYIGSYTAFNDVISLTITGFYGSYLLPASLLLYHRIKGHVLPHGTSPEDAPEISGMIHPIDAEKVVSRNTTTTTTTTTTTSEVGVAQIKLIWGPWHIPGLLGTINNAYACVYMVFVIFWSVWPPVTPVVASTMNYSVVVTGGVLILAFVWYFIRGRRVYKGPLVEREVVDVMRRSGSIVSVK